MRTWTLVVSICAHAIAIAAVVVAPIFAIDGSARSSSPPDIRIDHSDRGARGARARPAADGNGACGPVNPGDRTGVIPARYNIACCRFACRRRRARWYRRAHRGIRSCRRSGGCASAAAAGAQDPVPVGGVIRPPTRHGLRPADLSADWRSPARIEGTRDSAGGDRREGQRARSAGPARTSAAQGRGDSRRRPVEIHADTAERNASARGDDGDGGVYVDEVVTSKGKGQRHRSPKRKGPLRRAALPLT